MKIILSIGIIFMDNIDYIVEQMLQQWPRIYEWLRSLSDETSRFLGFFAWLNWFLEKNRYGRIIIVGGFAVEVYTGSTYRTLDVDIITEGPLTRKILEKILEKITHEKTSRVYITTLPVLAAKAIDIVGSNYTSSRPPVKIRLDKYYVYVEAPEELIVKYLAAWKYWKSEEDRDKALLLYKSLRGRLDLNYIKNRARMENVEDLLRKLEEI